MSPYELGPVPATTAAPATELDDGKDAKDIAYTANVAPVHDGDVENGSSKNVYDGKERYDMIIPEGVDPALMPHEDVRRGLKQRHIQMIALAGAIGTGLFLGAGRSIRRTGPLGSLIAYTAVGGLVISVMGCIAELSSLAPVSGAYIRHSDLFVDPALSFAIGWSTFYGSAVSVPAEWTAVAVIMSYWSDLNPGVWIAICIVLTFLTNIFFIRIYGEIELVAAFLKIALILGCIIFGLIYDLGGIPGKERIGFYYWQNPGPMGQGYYYLGTAAGQFAGFWITLINAVYAYSGVETIAIAAAETKNPRRNIPKACKRVFYRVCIFYLLSIFVVGLIVPSNDPAIATNAGNAKTSPFAIAAQRAGIKALPSIINAVVLTSAWSSGNHGMLTGSRSLYAMALEGRAPRIFRRVSRFGIPWVAVTVQGMFQLLAFMSLGSGGASEAFEWLTNLNSANTLVIWIVIGICSWRMRKAMKAQGISPDQLPYKFPGQPYLAQITIWGSTLILLTGGFYVFLAGNWDLSSFFSSYFAILFTGVTYIGWKLFKKTKIVPIMEVPIAPFIAIADANPEEPPKKKSGPAHWFATFWWD